MGFSLNNCTHSVTHTNRGTQRMYKKNTQNTCFLLFVSNFQFIFKFLLLFSQIFSLLWFMHILTHISACMCLVITHFTPIQTPFVHLNSEQLLSKLSGISSIFFCKFTILLRSTVTVSPFFNLYSLCFCCCCI